MNMNRRRSRNIAVLRTCLVAGLFSLSAVEVLSAQIVPGKLPPGPPQQPGQLSEEPKKPGDTPKDAPATDDKPTFGNKSDDYTYTITTRRVVVPTTVLDPDGHGYVTGLKASDFEVYDNDKPQKVDAELIEQPLSVVLAVQANSDVQGFLPKLRRSANLLHGLVTGENGDVAVLAFDHRMQVLQNFTSDPDKLDDAMQHLRSGSSSSAIIDAVLESARMLKAHDRENKRRRVILLLSRDINKGSQAKLQETIRYIQFESIVVYCIDISKFLSAITKDPGYPRPAHGGIPPEAMPSTIGGGNPSTMTTDAQNANLGNALELVPPLLTSIHDIFKKPPARALTYFTGGRVYNFGTERGLERAITDLGEDLNSQYVLSYTQSEETRKEPGFHNIRVVVDRPGLQIRTRPGYWWGGGEIN